MRVYQFRHIRARRILAAAASHPAPQPARPYGVTFTMTRLLGLLCLLALCCLPLAAGRHRTAAATGPRTEVIVTLASPPLAGRGARPRAPRRRRAGPLRRRAPRPDPDRLDPLALPHRHERRRRRRSPARRSPRSGRFPACGRSTRASPTRAPATTVTKTATAAKAWSTGLPNQGDGIKIGIIDDGIDQTHGYFSPAGYTMPPGYPKGQTAYTTAKVIVARAFAPAGTTWKYALKPFDPVESGHATHVAGIAAGNAGTNTGQPDRLGRRAARLPRQLQGAQRPDSGRGSRRQRRGDRGRDRGRRQGRHERDQPLDRRAGGGAVARPRRARDRRGGGRRRHPRDRGRERLRRLRPRLGRLPRDSVDRDHRGGGDDPERGRALDLAGFSSARARPRSRCASSRTSARPASRSSPPSRVAGSRCPAPRWRRRRSPARPHSSASGIRTGRSRRSRPR